MLLNSQAFVLTVEPTFIPALVSLHGATVRSIGRYTSLIQDCSPPRVISSASKLDLVNTFAF